MPQADAGALVEQHDLFRVPGETHRLLDGEVGAGRHCCPQHHVADAQREDLLDAVVLDVVHLGFDRRTAAEGVALLERIFEQRLDGHRLMDGQHPHVGCASWRNFQTLTNARWYHDNVVLMGDAAHTTHFTIGLGTRLALEDAIELAADLRKHHDVQSALARYDRTRQAALLLPQSEARYSAEWFEDVPRYIGLESAQFFALMRERRSPLLPHLPPHMYYRLHRATQEFSALRKLRSWVGPGARELYSRRRPRPIDRTGPQAAHLDVRSRR